MRISLLMLILLTITFSYGCASLGVGKSNYSCQGYPEGVNCKSAREVYMLTDYQEAVVKSKSEQEKKGKKDKGNQDKKVDNKELKLSSRVQAIRQKEHIGPIPIRTPSRVMRIWIAPWEDKEGFLHLDSYIYAEVETRRWMIGEELPGVEKQLRPLQIDGPRIQNPDKVNAYKKQIK